MLNYIYYKYIYIIHVIYTHTLSFTFHHDWVITEKVSEFLDFHPKFIMQNGEPYIQDFLAKRKILSLIANGEFLVTACSRAVS